MALLYNHKLTISGSTWDYNLGNFAEATLTANKTINVTNTADMSVGFLTITQGGSGGYTLTLSGTFSDNFEVLSGVGNVTMLSFVNRGGELYWSMVGQYTVIGSTTTTTTNSTTTTTTAPSTTTTTTGGSTTTTTTAAPGTFIAFTSASAPNSITQGPTGTWTTASTGDGQGIATSVSLNASNNGSISQKYLSASNVGAIVGFKTSNTNGDYSTFTYGVFTSAGVWKKIQGGSIINLQTGGVDINVGVNDIALVERVSTNQFQVRINGVVPTTNGTFTPTSTAQVYAALDISVVGNTASEVRGVNLT